VLHVGESRPIPLHVTNRDAPGVVSTTWNLQHGAAARMLRDQFDMDPGGPAWLGSGTGFFVRFGRLGSHPEVRWYPPLHEVGKPYLRVRYVGASGEERVVDAEGHSVDLWYGHWNLFLPDEEDFDAHGVLEAGIDRHPGQALPVPVHREPVRVWARWKRRGSGP
jgi:hypothetical protein